MDTFHWESIIRYIPPLHAAVVLSFHRALVDPTIDIDPQMEAVIHGTWQGRYTGLSGIVSISMTPREKLTETKMRKIVR